MATQIHQADVYGEKYARQNYFRYQHWIYEPYISSLIKFCGLRNGSSMLDVGCGQGFFSYLFAQNGMRVLGIDASEMGIRAARELYGHLPITFCVSDIKTATLPEQFDCIFVRSCSLYNTDEFPWQGATTEYLLKHLKPWGTFIFAYNSNFSSKISPNWRYHSLEDVQKHFSSYSHSQVFFLNKLLVYLLRQHSFTRAATRSTAILSKTFGIGGDLICILRKG